MKKIVFIVLISLLGKISFAQTKIYCSEKLFCKVISEDQSECNSTKEEILFSLSCDQTFIAEIIDNKVVTTFEIDSSKYDKIKNIFDCQVHTSTGEKLNLVIDSSNVKIQSLDHIDISLVYKIEKANYWKTSK